MISGPDTLDSRRHAGCSKSLGSPDGLGGSGLAAASTPPQTAFPLQPDEVNLADVIPSERQSNYFSSRTWVYVLLCEGEKYYIGFSKNLHRRLVQHFSGNGSVFTRCYRPVSVLFYQEGDESREVDIWSKFVHVFGRENVGGWSKDFDKRICLI